MRKSEKSWAPQRIYLTRDGWNDTLPEDGDILWSRDRITKNDIIYYRAKKKPEQSDRGR